MKSLQCTQALHRGLIYAAISTVDLASLPQRTKSHTLDSSYCASFTDGHTHASVQSDGVGESAERERVQEVEPAFARQNAVRGGGGLGERGESVQEVEAVAQFEAEKWEGGGEECCSEQNKTKTSNVQVCLCNTGCTQETCNVINTGR